MFTLRYQRAENCIMRERCREWYARAVRARGGDRSIVRTRIRFVRCGTFCSPHPPVRRALRTWRVVQFSCISTRSVRHCRWTLDTTLFEGERTRFRRARVGLVNSAIRLDDLVHERTIRSMSASRPLKYSRISRRCLPSFATGGWPRLRRRSEQAPAPLARCEAGLRIDSPSAPRSRICSRLAVEATIDAPHILAGPPR
jgi:hypothetical protein